MGDMQKHLAKLEKKKALENDMMQKKKKNKSKKDKGSSSDEYEYYYVSKDGSEHGVHKKRLRRKLQKKAKSFGQLIEPRKQKDVKDMMQKKKNNKSKKDKGSSSDEYESYYVSKDGSEHDVHKKRLRRKLREKAKSFGQLIEPRKQKDVKDMTQKKKKNKSKKDKGSSSDEYESYYVSK